MKIKTPELIGEPLNYAVASYADKHVTVGDIVWGNYAPSTNPAQAYPIIFREKISLGNQEHMNVPDQSAWYATNRSGSFRWSCICYINELLST